MPLPEDREETELQKVLLVKGSGGAVLEVGSPGSVTSTDGTQEEGAMGRQV